VGAAGPVTGVIGSLVAPWVNWGVKKRRARLQRRQHLVTEWRKGLHELESTTGTLPAYEHLARYQSLQPHLRERRRGNTRPFVPPERASHVTPTGSRLGTLVEISDTSSTW
jgi:hypothetical protein